MNDKPQNMPPVPPFVKFVCANVPMVFDDSLSYYEALSALWKYVSGMTDVINNNATLEEEYIAKFEELKTFVDTYFDNLDVQEEINNKLDQMVEDGDFEPLLSDLIAGVEHDLDVAVEELQGDIADTKSELEGDIATVKNEITNEQKGMWGISRSQYGHGTSSSDNTHYLMYSDDGISWEYVGKKIDALTSDSSSVCEINGIFYYVGNNTYQYSTDLVNWSNAERIIEETGRPIWAGWFYYDEANEDIYCYMSYQDPVVVGDTSVNHKIVYVKGKQNTDGSITFEDNYHNFLTSEDESYIDPTVIYDPVWGYLFACKVNKTTLPNEVDGSIRIYNMTDLTTISSVKLTLSGSGSEAPQLITDGQGNISVYVQDYNFLGSMNATYGTPVSTDIPSTTSVIRLSNTHLFAGAKTNARIMLKEPLSFRHIGVSYCTPKAYYLLKQIGIKPVTPMSNQHMNSNIGLTYVDLNTEGGTYYIANSPNVVYIVGSENHLRNVTLIPIAAYAHEPFKLMLAQTKITWSGNFLPSWYGNHTLENTDTKWNYIEFLPLTSGSVRPPYNGTVA